jgi:hypothetical protein
MNWTKLLLKTMTADYWAILDFTPVAIAMLSTEWNNTVQVCVAQHSLRIFFIFSHFSK